MTVDEAIDIIKWYQHNISIALTNEKKEIDKKYNEAVEYLRKLENKTMMKEDCKVNVNGG